MKWVLTHALPADCRRQNPLPDVQTHAIRRGTGLEIRGQPLPYVRQVLQAQLGFGMCFERIGDFQLLEQPGLG